MSIKVVDLIDGHLLEDAWRLYYDAFEPLNAHAVQRHLMYRSEFDQVVADRRVLKFLDIQGDRIDGIATFTNILESMPLISPAYFAQRWPTEYAEHRVWYCGFVACRRAGRGIPDTAAFAALVEAMWRTAADDGGIIALDFCRHTEARGMARVVPAMLHRLAGDVTTERMDEQTYWMYQFPGGQP